MHNNGLYAFFVCLSKEKPHLVQVAWSFLAEWPTSVPNSTDWSL